MTTTPLKDASNATMAIPGKAATNNTADDDDALLWSETGAEAETETAYSKMMASSEENATADMTTAATDGAPAIAADTTMVAALTSPMVSKRRKRQSYGAVVDSLAAGAASTPVQQVEAALPVAMDQENDDDDASALQFDSDLEEERESTKDQESSQSAAEDEPMEDLSDAESGDESDKEEDSKEAAAAETVAETKEKEASEADSDEDEPETQPLDESKSSGRTKKTLKELSELKAAAESEDKEPTEEPEAQGAEEPETDEPTADETGNADATATAASTAEKLAPAPPDKASIIASTDNLYTQVEDKQMVTLKDIFLSLKAEYGSKLDKQTKAIVRQRLTDLISGEAEPLVDDGGNVSDVGDSESESEAEQEQSDYEDDEQEPAAKSKTTPKRRKKSPKSKQPRSSARRSKKSAKTLAVRVHADKLRKRRVEELRVRNEELQVHQSKEDQKRAELIAAKFETNTDELKIQRLEQRLDLLQKLDRKRITVIQEGSLVPKEEPVKEEKVDAPVVDIADAAAAESDESEDDSDDDMELEFVGASKSKLAPFALRSAKPSALSILNMADRAMVVKPSKKHVDLTGRQTQASPGRSISARAALRNKLQAKQRKMGNMWLARELGYKNEEDHLKDCMEVENRKMQLTMKKEEERLQLNQRKQLRERLMTQGEELFETEENDGDEEYVPPNQGEEQDPTAGAGEEEDEEMEMAKAIEKEQADDDAAGDGDDDFPANDDTSMDIDEAPAPVDDAVAPVETGQLETQPLVKSVPCTESEDSNKLETQPSVGQAPKESASSSSEVDTELVSNDASNAAVEKNVDPTEEVKDLQESDDDAEFEMTNEVEEPVEEKPKGPRNSAWKAMLKKDAENAKKAKKRKNGLVEEEADEEEEEEVAGLEDFGFSVHKKKKDDDDEGDDELDQDDMDNVVDDISDNEGDEEEGERARREMARREEKDNHKEMIRRMRDGYDGRRGGIAGGGAGARGIHRFDQLVAADNREDAKRLGLLNDDEVDSDQEGEDKADAPEEDDEAVLLDKMLKDRFLHRSSVELEEDFSDDEKEDENEAEAGEAIVDDSKEDKEQEVLAKRFAKRARMQRLMDAYGHEEEFSQSKLIDEDTALKLELQKMKNGLVRKRSQSALSRNSSSSNSNAAPTDGVASKKQKTTASFGNSFLSKGGSLAIALQANRRPKSRTSFMRGSSSGTQESTASLQKSIAFNHVVFQTNSDSQLSKSNMSSASNGAWGRGGGASALPSRRPAPTKSRSTSLWSKAVVTGFQKRR